MHNLAEKQTNFRIADLFLLHLPFHNFSRNRLVDEGNAAEQQCISINPDGSTYHAYSLVLMDENLLNVAREKPFYITEESQRTLSTAIRRDTDFLEANGMMDYSLLVAIDGCRNELILGIIDYIRVYTWDKQLESLIKSTGGMFAGSGKKPTVVAPDVYKKRFEHSMTKYFTLVPDFWYDSNKVTDKIYTP